MAIKKHWHYKFVGYNKKGEARNEIMFPAEVLVKDYDSEAEALHEVKQKIDRKHYYCKEAWECTACGLQEEQVEAQKEQVEVQSRIAKSMEKLNDNNWFIRLFRKKHD